MHVHIKCAVWKGFFKCYPSEEETLRSQTCSPALSHLWRAEWFPTRCISSISWPSVSARSRRRSARIPHPHPHSCTEWAMSNNSDTIWLVWETPQHEVLFVSNSNFRFKVVHGQKSRIIQMFLSFFNAHTYLCCISDYCIYWKQLCCFVFFVETEIHFIFQDL